PPWRGGGRDVPITGEPPRGAAPARRAAPRARGRVWRRDPGTPGRMAPRQVAERRGRLDRCPGRGRRQGAARLRRAARAVAPDLRVVAVGPQVGDQLLETDVRLVVLDLRASQPPRTHRRRPYPAMR